MKNPTPGKNPFELESYRDRMPLFQNKALTQMLQVYALICMIIALVTIDHIPQGLLELSR